MPHEYNFGKQQARLRGKGVNESGLRAGEDRRQKEVMDYEGLLGWICMSIAVRGTAAVSGAGKHWLT
jgi:hypothetical protein